MDRFSYDGFQQHATEAIIAALKEDLLVRAHFLAIVNGHRAPLEVVTDHLTFLLVNWTKGVPCQPGIVRETFLKRIVAMMLITARVYTDWWHVMMLLEFPNREQPRNDLAVYGVELARTAQFPIPQGGDPDERENVFGSRAYQETDPWLEHASLRASSEEPASIYGARSFSAISKR